MSSARPAKEASASSYKKFINFALEEAKGHTIWAPSPLQVLDYSIAYYCNIVCCFPAKEKGSLLAPSTLQLLDYIIAYYVAICNIIGLKQRVWYFIAEGCSHVYKVVYPAQEFIVPFA